METEEFKTEGRNRKQIMVDLNAKISIMTLNVNGLNTSMRRQGMDFLNYPTICCLQETHFKYNDINWLKLKYG